MEKRWYRECFFGRKVYRDWSVEEFKALIKERGIKYMDCKGLMSLIVEQVETTSQANELLRDSFSLISGGEFDRCQINLMFSCNVIFNIYMRKLEVEHKKMEGEENE